MRRLLIIIICCLTYSKAVSQVNILFIPEIYGRTVNGLFNCKFTNPYGKQTVALTITVNERKAGTICVINTGLFTLLPGTNPIPSTAISSASIKFASSRSAQVTGLSRNFPEGDYDYCYELSFPHSDNQPIEQCYSYTLAPFAELNLSDPYDRDTICNPKPLLTWEPLLPAVTGAFYQLVLTEVKPGQNPTEALNYNLPIINQSDIMSPVLPYPSVLPPLVKDKTYAWQVTAYKGQTVLNRSEIWQFKVHCLDSAVKAIPDIGYRDIEDLLRGNYYIAEGYIKFSVINAYGPGRLKYEVRSVNKPGKKIHGLPALKLKNGINNITIDLRENSSLDDNHYYILKIWLPDGASRELRFIYFQPQ